MKRKLYLILDTETATLPYANEVCKTAKEKQKISIAKPLVYDIGWIIADRQGNIYTRKNYLVQETFFVPNVFNTAYYKDKRPQYLRLLAEGKIYRKDWNEIMEILLEDLRKCDYCTAYNATFDFKKAIPFTERYISALYSEHYNEWENRQKKLIQDMLCYNESPKNETFLDPMFVLRGEDFPMADLWGLACERLLDNERYKDFCLKNKLLSPSGVYFSTNAENSFRYLIKDVDFIENHTALSDAEIETEILMKILRKGAIKPQITPFPFRELGNTVDYVLQVRKSKYAETVYDLIAENIPIEEIECTRYHTYLKNLLEKLEEVIDTL